METSKRILMVFEGEGDVQRKVKEKASWKETQAGRSLIMREMDW